MDESDKRKVLSIYPDKETKEWVETAAKADGRSANNYILNLIRLERNRSKK